MTQEVTMADGQEPTTEPEGQEPTATIAAPATEPNGKQDVFDAEYVRKLRDEAAGYRTRLKEFEDRDKTEAEVAAEKAQKAEGRATEAELRVMRYEVAAEKGLDLKIAAALAGTTKEELAANADLILGVTGSNNASNFDGGARKTAPPTDMDSLIRRQAGFGG